VLHDDELTEGYATAHSARQTIANFKEFLDIRVEEFLARSPDLTIMDYFMCPYLKNTVFKSTSHTIQELCDFVPT
jgi:hypothetical protein